MLEQFRQIPAPLQKQISLYLSGSLLGLVMMIMILAFHGSWQLIIPSLIIALVFLINGCVLFCRCTEGQYVVIQGVCTEIERTGFKKRIKAVYIRSGEHAIKVVHQLQRIRDLSAGDGLVLYLADNAPVYEVDGYKVVCNALAIGKESSVSDRGGSIGKSESCKNQEL